MRQIALERDAAEMVFPPLRSTRDVQAALPQRTALLVFFTTYHDTYGFLMAKQQYSTWKVESGPAIEKRLSALLKTLGNFDGNHEILESQLNDNNWRCVASELTRRFTRQRSEPEGESRRGDRRVGGGSGWSALVSAV